MRKNTQRAIDAFMWLEASPMSDRHSSIWSDGRSIWSYSTIIVTWLGDKLAINMTRYSKTTSTHQRAILAELRRSWDEDSILQVDGLPMGSDHDALYWSANEEMAP